MKRAKSELIDLIAKGAVSLEARAKIRERIQILVKRITVWLDTQQFHVHYNVTEHKRIDFEPAIDRCIDRFPS